MQRFIFVNKYLCWLLRWQFERTSNNISLHSVWTDHYHWKNIIGKLSFYRDKNDLNEWVAHSRQNIFQFTDELYVSWCVLPPLLSVCTQWACGLPQSLSSCMQRVCGLPYFTLTTLGFWSRCGLPHLCAKPFNLYKYT